MLDVRWSRRTRADLSRIAAFVTASAPEFRPHILGAIRDRVRRMSDGHWAAGRQVVGLPAHYRVYAERRYHYLILYRAEGNPPEMLAAITIRHGRERPLKPATIRRYAR